MGRTQRHVLRVLPNVGSQGLTGKEGRRKSKARTRKEKKRIEGFENGRPQVGESPQHLDVRETEGGLCALVQSSTQFWEIILHLCHDVDPLFYCLVLNLFGI